MDSTHHQDKYRQYYQSLGLERSGLFKLIQDRFKPETVLYPGCSIHITPSFFFRHVVYIDQSPEALKFFSNPAQVDDLMKQYRQYSQTPWWRFISGDFHTLTGLKESSFDLLLSLFAGPLIASCEKYVKPGGLILTGSLFSDHESLRNREDYHLIARIQSKNREYIFSEPDDNSRVVNSVLRPKNKGFEYQDRENYFVYQKVIPRRR